MSPAVETVEASEALIDHQPSWADLVEEAEESGLCFVPVVPSWASVPLPLERSREIGELRCF